MGINAILLLRSEFSALKSSEYTPLTTSLLNPPDRGVCCGQSKNEMQRPACGNHEPTCS